MTRFYEDPSITVQPDGLAVTKTMHSNRNTEISQYYVVKEGNVELSAKYPSYEQASSELGRLLLESSSRNLRVAVVDRFGNELLRG